MDTNSLDWLSIVLVIVGAVNWGIIGLTGLLDEPFNLVESIVEGIFRPEAGDVVLNLVYILVGLAGLYLVYTAYKMGRASRRANR